MTDSMNDIFPYNSPDFALAEKLAEDHFTLMDKLIRHRMNSDLSIVEMSKKMNIDIKTVEEFESMKIDPTLMFIRRYALALGIELNTNFSVFPRFICQENFVRTDELICSHRESGGKQCENLEPVHTEHKFGQHTIYHEYFGNGYACSAIEDYLKEK